MRPIRRACPLPPARRVAWLLTLVTAINVAPFALSLGGDGAGWGLVAKAAAADGATSVRVASVSPLSGPSGVTTDIVCVVSTAAGEVPAGELDVLVDDVVIARSVVAGGSGDQSASIRTNGIVTGDHLLVCSFRHGDTGDVSASDATTVTRTPLPVLDLLDPLAQPGALTVSSPFSTGSPFDLGALTLDATATHYTTGAPLDGILIADGRSTRPGFEAHVSVSPFVSAGQSFGGSLAGLVTVRAVQVPGSPLAAADIEVQDWPPSEPGLGEPRRFARYPAELPGGSVLFTARLAISDVPTSMAPGTYTSTVTVTVS